MRFVWNSHTVPPDSSPRLLSGAGPRAARSADPGARNDTTHRHCEEPAGLTRGDEAISTKHVPARGRGPWAAGDRQPPGAWPEVLLYRNAAAVAGKHPPL